MIKAKVILYSRHKDRSLITMEIEAPKFIDAEIEKHRMISTNSSSDRAIPVKRMLEKEPFIPTDVRKNQKGMQGTELLTKSNMTTFNSVVNSIYKNTKSSIQLLDSAIGVHKQHLNRYLLPFSIQKKVMTATLDEWKYFDSLRNHPDADPVIQELAEKIWIAIEEASGINHLNLDDWHLPYITSEDWETVCDSNKLASHKHLSQILLQASAARCARVSYNNHDGSKPDIEKDIKLFKQLAESNPPHMSPLDHQGIPVVNEQTYEWPLGVTHMFRDREYGSGNFKGWIQFRHFYLQGGFNEYD